MIVIWLHGQSKKVNACSILRVQSDSCKGMHLIALEKAAFQSKISLLSNPSICQGITSAWHQNVEAPQLDKKGSAWAQTGVRLEHIPLCVV